MKSVKHWSLRAYLRNRAALWKSHVTPRGVIWAASLALVTLVIACQGQLLPTSSNNPTEPLATELTLNAGDSLVMSVGTTFQLQAVARDSAGQPVAGYAITWSSSNASVATIDDTGWVTAVGLGDAAITAVAVKNTGTGSQPLTKQLGVTVDPEPAASVEVVPSQATVQVNGTIQLAAIVRDASGNQLPGRAVAWSSSDESIATVDAQAFVTGVDTGSAIITATSEGVSGDATITVEPAPPPPPSPVVDVVVWPSDVPLETGQKAQFYAAILSADSTVTCQPENPSTDPNVLFNANVVAGCDSATARLDFSKANGTAGGVPWAGLRAARVTHPHPAAGGDK